MRRSQRRQQGQEMEPKEKDSMSCLNCSAFPCWKHIKPHFVPPFKKQVESSKKPQENICPLHNKAMDMFCYTDQQCICCLCSEDEHKDHDTVSAAAERTHKQTEVELSLKEIQQRLHDQRRDVQKLERKGTDVSRSVDKAVADNKEVFASLIQLLRERSGHVRQLMTSLQEAKERRIKGLEEKLQQEISELKRRDNELRQLSLTQDHTQFLLNYPSLSAPLGPTTHSPSVNVAPASFCEDVTAAVSQVRGQVQGVLSQTWTKMGLTMTEDDVLEP